MRVAVFGGSFNPPHVAHLLAVTLVLAGEEVDEVVVVPAFRHPFSKNLAPFEDRVAMTELALGWLPRVSISRVEETLGGESRTLRTLQHLLKEHPEWSLRLVMGSDLLGETSKWHGFQEICALAPPLVVARSGFEQAPGHPSVLPAISSTDVRAKIAAGAWGELGELLPRAVLRHIRAHHLYGAPPSSKE
jgi:nicotinate-nucleotide adenylyltransferase